MLPLEAALLGFLSAVSLLLPIGAKTIQNRLLPMTAMLPDCLPSGLCGDYSQLLQQKHSQLLRLRLSNRPSALRR